MVDWEFHKVDPMEIAETFIVSQYCPVWIDQNPGRVHFISVVSRRSERSVSNWGMADSNPCTQHFRISPLKLPESIPIYYRRRLGVRVLAIAVNFCGGERKKGEQVERWMGLKGLASKKNLQESPHHGFGPSQAVDVRQLTGWDLSGSAHLIPLGKGGKQQHDCCKKKQTIDCDEVESRRFRELSWLVGLDELEDESWECRSAFIAGLLDFVCLEILGPLSACIKKNSTFNAVPPPRFHPTVVVTLWGVRSTNTPRPNIT